MATLLQSLKDIAPENMPCARTGMDHQTHSVRIAIRSTTYLVVATKSCSADVICISGESDGKLIVYLPAKKMK